MFKAFLIILGSLVGLVISYHLFRLAKTLVKGIIKRVPKPKRMMTKEERMNMEMEEFKKELFQKYTDTKRSLEEKVKVAIDIKKTLTESIKNNEENAKRCKQTYMETGNEEYKDKAYLFLVEKQTSTDLLALAEKTISMCKDKLEVANIEFQSIISRLDNRVIELKLLESIGEEGKVDSKMAKFDFNRILADYDRKIDVARINYQVEESLKNQQQAFTSKKMLGEATVDPILITDKVKLAFNSL